MFDAKSLLETIVRGAAPGGAGGGGLADILGKVLQGGQGGAGDGRHASPAAQGGGLEDLLRNLTQGGGSAGGGQSGGLGGLGDLLKNMMPQAPSGSQSNAQPIGGPGGGLGDILGNLQKQLGGGQGGASTGTGGGGGLMDILGQVLGQATAGAKEGAQRIDDATGIGKQARDALGQATGKSPEDLLQQLKDLIPNNPTAAAAGAGGLGAVVLGTRTGRSVAASAAKLGALVLIGGLAYKAYQNYSAGRPVLGGQMEAAPQGSGFEPDAITQESAALYIRAMIAAAAADGRIDGTEQQKIMGGLKQAGADAEAEEFIANELNNPASASDLAAAVQSPEEALQVFTAAHIAVDLDTQEEHDFLVELAQRLQLDPKLVQNVDAAAKAA